jgi:H/ACA ribonucleoprotein complex subunit 2
MAKDRDSSKASHPLPEKEKKKKKRSDEDGVRKPSSDKKEKKEKKAKREALAEKALNGIRAAPAPAEAKSDDEEEVAEAGEAKSKQVLRPAGALVPFANPLADDKVAKKVFKSVKKGVCLMMLSKTIIWELTCHAINQRPHNAR